MAPPRSKATEVLIVAGQIASGKTTLAETLTTRGNAHLVRVRGALQETLGGANWDRKRLQREGAALDERTSGRWLLDYLQGRVSDGGRWVVDAGRTRRQVEPVLEEITESNMIYLRAHESTRRYRYGLGQVMDPVKRAMAFDDAMLHPTETEAETLLSMAHFVVDTDDLSVSELATTAQEWLGW
jgi:hypothetical protein